MRTAKLVIWDEPPMQRHQAYTPVTRMLQDICGHYLPAAAHMDFGGEVSVQASMTLCCMCRTCSICFRSGLGVCLGCVPDLGVALLDGWAWLQVVVFGGDFRQILPVVPRGKRPDIVLATLNRAPFWPSVKVMRLADNMRVCSLQGQDAQSQQEFADLLLQVILCSAVMV